MDQFIFGTVLAQILNIFKVSQIYLFACLFIYLVSFVFYVDSFLI